MFNKIKEFFKSDLIKGIIYMIAADIVLIFWTKVCVKYNISLFDKTFSMFSIIISVDLLKNSFILLFKKSRYKNFSDK